jgi:mRNA interferase MazF
MSVIRGQIVLLDMPFSHGKGSKVRPALVVQFDRNNARMTNTIVAAITRNISRVNQPTQLLIKIGTPASAASGLLADSAVTCENLFTVDQRFIQRVIGDLPSDAMRQIDQWLIAALGLP